MDTRLFSWSETEIRIAGGMAVGIMGAQWNVEQEKEEVYGKGNEPLAIKSGNKKYAGTLTLLQNELERLLDSFKGFGSDVTSIPAFEVQIAFANETGDLVTYSLSGCQFTSGPMNAAQNMKRMEIALPIMYLRQRRT
jgi:hypothetical protein